MSGSDVCGRGAYGCPSYWAGHTAHAIQFRLTSEYLENFPERCRSVELEDLGEGHFRTLIDGRSLRGWNHSPEQVTEFSRESRRGLVQYVPFSGVLMCARLDESGRVFGRTLIYPFWEGGETPETTDGLSRGVDRRLLLSGADGNNRKCDTDAPGHGATGGVAPGDLPAGDFSGKDFVRVTFGSWFAGQLEVRFPGGVALKAHHCDRRYLPIFTREAAGDEVYYHLGTGLLVRGTGEHRKFLSVSWEELDECPTSASRNQ
ncbi:MAG TPA: hypothetical protein H9870_10035 [Candidatus Corynebacterium avicola]|uniref:Uncharacterized protein n=1 Tax=Candidatus Corynebacterium avicola TaxID=2838527 RepID=A0A9D1RP76_9CORY|nr:hypothetical protein [Candidatus Corynebacterium avicola]